MKKIMNDPANVVHEMLLGVSKANRAKLVYHEGMGVIARSEKTGNVGVVSGGGCGHEPAHAGYVGDGMLDAAVAGNVFSSPDPERILCGIRAADAGKGVLLVIKNYSGDYMNFTMAQELAGLEDIAVDYVVVKDDVAVEDSTFSTGRRGIAGTVFVHKIAGAKALTGASLAEVKKSAQKAADNVRSMGMSMSACTLPAVGKPGFILADDEIEIGMGIHGEPGVGKSGILSSKELAETLLGKIIADMEETGPLAGQEVALMVNGLGATPMMELYILANDACEYLSGKGINIHKTFVGNYMTALEMAGCSLSLLRLDGERKDLLDAPCDTLAFHI